MLERAQLLIAHRAVILVAAQLRQGKGEQVRGPGVVALQALGAAVPVPGLLPLASRSMRILHGEGSLLTGGGDERGLGLSVVPGVRVAVPGGAVPVKNLGFEPAAAVRIAALHFQRDGPGQHAVLGKKSLPIVIGLRNGHRVVIKGDTRRARQCQEALRRRLVGPLLGVDGKRDYARCRRVQGDRGEQPGLAQPPWKGRARVLDVIGHELIDAARIVVIKKV